MQEGQGPRRLSAGRGEEFKSQCQQSIPYQHRGGLSVFVMHGGSAASNRRIIETGQVVVYQRSTVDQFDGTRGPEYELSVFRARGEGQTDREGEPWPDAPTSGEHRVMHRPMKTRGSPMERGQSLEEASLDRAQRILGSP